MKIIIAIIGESGTGKTMIAEDICDKYGINQIQSYTDRLPRKENEKGHTFISKEEFNKLNKEDMIAYTNFGSHRYCCLAKDVKDLNVYVIDEIGLQKLKKNKEYKVITIGVFATWLQRWWRTDRKRRLRDKGMFNLKPCDFDYAIFSRTKKKNTLKQIPQFILVLNK